MQRSAFLLTALLLSAGAPAQADGWAPPAHARRGGNNGIAMPGNWTVGRQQHIVDKVDFPAGFIPPRLLTKIAYRRSAYPSTISTTYAGKPMMMEVSIGNSQIAANAMTITYASNQPGDLSIVMPLTSLSLPTDPPIGAFNEVGPDIMIFPFTTPKLITGPHLFIEHVNNMAPYVATVYWTDMLDNRATILHGHNTLRGEFGCGATPPTPTNLRAPAAASANPLGGSTSYTLASATPNTALLFTIGLRLDRPYGITTPFDLAPIGAPLCPFWNSMEVISTGSTTGGGTATIVVSFPNDPSIAGAEVGMQALVVSPGFNAAGLTTSNGMSAWIGARFPMESSIVLGNSLTNPTGTLYLKGAPIVHLFWL